MFILVLYVAIKRIEFGVMNARDILVGTPLFDGVGWLISSRCLWGVLYAVCVYCTYNADTQGKGFTKFLSMMS